ncbi:hypothetical protein C4K04_2810 [Pseudomonas chlororaphis]|uniref:Uncharacterized protein n=1 Tax=Pseudomonas chlororaphis TaxID=587753 RepID=A0A3G7TPZ7_9PSED|nr:hypothetical protein C4K04_2810 [Pseudomonas chlororaphis]
MDFEPGRITRGESGAIGNGDDYATTEIQRRSLMQAHWQ